MGATTPDVTGSIDIACLGFSRQTAALYRIDERLASFAKMLPQGAHGPLAVALPAGGQQIAMLGL
jgi:hypothetical protein